MFGRDGGRVTITAHRGASAYAPENTLAAFRLAHDLGADGVELDVHLTADDQLVVLHDDTLDRTTSGSGLVREHAYAEIAALSAGAWFSEAFADERIPLLSQVLDWAHDAHMGLSIELKRPNAALGRAAYPDLAARVVAAVDNHAMRSRVLLFSDDH